MVFSFNLIYKSTKHWVEGTLTKLPSTRYAARSPRFPGYATIEADPIAAATAYRSGLLRWLDHHPEHQPKKETS